MRTASRTDLVFASAFLLASLVFLSGCLDGGGNGGNNGPDDLSLFKGIPSARIPGGCLAQRDDVCGLFDCMVESCWCADSPDKVLLEGKSVVESESQATSAVSAYLSASNSAYSAKRAVKLNTVFFNVFAENAGGDEEVFTVAADGTILKTVCGV